MYLKTEKSLATKKNPPGHDCAKTKAHLFQSRQSRGQGYQVNCHKIHVPFKKDFPKNKTKILSFSDIFLPGSSAWKQP